MTRAHLVPVLALSLLALACSKDDESPGPSAERKGGSGGSAKGGAGGAGGGGGGGGGAPSGSGGAGGSVTGAGGALGSGGAGSGGSGGAGSGGTSGSGGSGSVDARADAPSDAVAGGEAGPVPAEETLPNKPWIRLCPKAATAAQCCEFLCQCLAKTCADSAGDNPAQEACISSCTKLGNMQMRCRVYHCYESLNPGVPQDHRSHCGHASGRVGGGGCPAPVYN